MSSVPLLTPRASACGLEGRQRRWARTPQCEKCHAGTGCGGTVQVGTSYALGIVGRLPGRRNCIMSWASKTCRMALICPFNFYAFPKDLLNPRHYAKARKTATTEKDVTLPSWYLQGIGGEDKHYKNNYTKSRWERDHSSLQDLPKQRCRGERVSVGTFH